MEGTKEEGRIKMEDKEPICAFQDGSYPCYPTKIKDCELCLKIRLAAIKEVVEWIEQHLVSHKCTNMRGQSVHYTCLMGDWHAKLKDWGTKKC